MAAKNPNTIELHGITFNVDTEMFEDNYELVELLDSLEEHPFHFPRYIKMITGDKYDEVKEALRDENGRITLSAMREFADEFAAKVGELKN